MNPRMSMPGGRAAAALLLRFDKRGKATIIGAGFRVGPSSGTGFVFGPDKSLYVSEYDDNRVLKISRGGGGEPHCRARP
ncbi:MAG TPA: hypothetical protein VFS02_17400 [Telluria sp.]|nr:hypothetical protein [Telluria sp.]